MIELVHSCPVACEHKFLSSALEILHLDRLRGEDLVDLVHASGRPFILHSCGKIFDIMEDLIATGIDAKHSNEDSIAPFHKWVELYGDRICNLGGIDMNVLCQQTPDEIRDKVNACIAENIDFGGYGLGTGNSVPDYIPVEGFYAMLNTANAYRLSQYGG